MKKMLITGANSYIGNALENYIAQHYPQDYEIEKVSLRDGTWRNMDFGCYDVIFHVAGIAHADVAHVSDEVQQMYYRVNTDMAVEAAIKAKADGAKQFVFMSSMIVYGGAMHVTKDTKPQPANFYGDSKWQADCKIQTLNDAHFHVAVIRPPMIYGRDSKGNYPTLAKLARKLPVFPDVHNKRSMLYIENLCEFLCVIMQENRSGIFFPQNKDYVRTSDMVKEIALVSGKKICVTRVLAPFVAIGKLVPGKIGKLCQKAFGSSYYDLEMSDIGVDYWVADLKKSVYLTESKETAL